MRHIKNNDRQTDNQTNLEQKPCSLIFGDKICWIQSSVLVSSYFRYSLHVFLSKVADLQENPEYLSCVTTINCLLPDKRLLTQFFTWIEVFLQNPYLLSLQDLFLLEWIYHILYSIKKNPTKWSLCVIHNIVLRIIVHSEA